MLRGIGGAWALTKLYAIQIALSLCYDPIVFCVVLRGSAPLPIVCNTITLLLRHRTLYIAYTQKGLNLRQPRCKRGALPLSYRCLLYCVDLEVFETSASCMPCKCSTNWATSPYLLRGLKRLRSSYLCMSSRYDTSSPWDRIMFRLAWTWR